MGNEGGGEGKGNAWEVKAAGIIGRMGRQSRRTGKIINIERRRATECEQGQEQGRARPVPGPVPARFSVRFRRTRPGPARLGACARPGPNNRVLWKKTAGLGQPGSVEKEYRACSGKPTGFSY